MLRFIGIQGIGKQLRIGFSLVKIGIQAMDGLWNTISANYLSRGKWHFMPGFTTAPEIGQAQGCGISATPTLFIICQWFLNNCEIK